MTSPLLLDLRSTWSSRTPRPRTSRDQASLTAWVDGADLKLRMRLAWDLGLAVTVADASRIASATQATDAIVAGVLSRPGAVSPAAWADLGLVGTRITGTPFVPLALHAAGDRMLVHFTHDPDLVLGSGFAGTSDVAALRSTLGGVKEPGGYNFAFQAGSFDAENFGEDGFYGEDAVVFRAPHLATYNAESLDAEMVFLGVDVPKEAMIHLRRTDDVWVVLSTDGDVVASDPSLCRCLEWVRRNENSHGATLKGKRRYELLVTGDDPSPDRRFASATFPAR